MKNLSICLTLGALWACNTPPESARIDASVPAHYDLNHGGDALGGDSQTDLSTPKPDGTSAQALIGAACTANGDCLAGLGCDTTLPAGACSKDCQEDQDCGDSAHYGCVAGKCSARCNVALASNPCRNDYVCQRAGVQANCVADCRKVPCAQAGWICDDERGLCIDPNGGKFGQACGAETGGCDGTPNGICYSLAEFTRPFCTIGCSLFTNPCPPALVNAACLVGTATNAYCAYLCDPPNVPCPTEALKCIAFGQDYNVCVPKSEDDE